MNKKCKILVISCMAITMVLGMQVSALANTDNFEAQSRTIEGATTFVSENVSRIIGSPRGMLISSVELSIEDLGGGNVELGGSVFCHEAMEEIKLNLYLDQWFENSESWGQIEKFEFDWLAEDYPDDDLNMAHATVEVSNVERGTDYRVRGIAGAWDLDSDLYEVWNESAPSIYVE